MELTLDEALQKGIEAHKTGQIQEADSLYTAILKAQPKHPGANHNMGLLAVGLGKIQEALQFFSAALEAKPSVGQFWLSYIDALIKLDRIADAKAAFNQAKDKGANGEAFDCLEKLLAEQITNIQDPSSDQLQPIINLYSQGQLQLALSRSTEMLNKFPYSVVLFNIVGASNLGLMKFDAAIEGFKQALKIKPNFAEAFNNMGTALRGKGDLDAAIKSYKQALKIRPEYAGAYSNMSVALTDKGDLQAAINSCKQALRIEPNNAEAFNNMGNALKNKGELESAISSYEQALNIKPDFAEVFNNMGTALDAKGSSEAAINSFNQALKFKPDYAEAHYNLGVVLLGIRQYEKAVKYLKFSDFENSKYHLLKCLYLQDKKSSFYDQLDYLIIKGEIHPLIGSLGCRSVLKYGIERPNLFCKDPLNYLLKTQLNEQYDFEKIFIKTAKKILNKDRILNKKQGLLTNGYQTSGNLFSLERDLTENIEKIIRLAIENYLVFFKDSEEGFITSWPTTYSLYGWLVSMKSGGKLRPHMHEKGWISGSIYLNVPPKSKIDSGNLVVCIEDDDLAGTNINQTKSIDVITGNLCLFPASLLHYTIPFESEEERIVLAFDVVPKY